MWCFTDANINTQSTKTNKNKKKCPEPKPEAVSTTLTEAKIRYNSASLVCNFRSVVNVFGSFFCQLLKTHLLTPAIAQSFVKFTPFWIACIFN